MSVGSVGGSSWFGRVGEQSRASATTSPRRATAGGRVGSSADRAHLSGRGVSRGDILRDARSAADSFFGSLSRGVEDLGHGGSRLVQGVSDFLGRRVGDAVRAPGEIAGAVTRVGSQAVAGALELGGNRRAAEQVRRAGRTASAVLHQSSEGAGEIASNFVSGVGDGVGGLVDSIGTAVAHPVQTLEGLNRLNQLVNPLAQMDAAVREVAQGRSPLNVYRQNAETVSGIIEGVREDYRRTGRDHGTAGQVGRAAFDILSTVLTGGESAVGRTGIRVAANSLDDFARASRAVRAGETVAGTGRASRAGEVAGRVLPAGVGERVTRASEALRDLGVARSEGQIARSRAAGEGRVRSGQVPGADGAEALGASRRRAGALRNELPETRSRWEAGGASREELVNQLPTESRQRVRQLEAEGRADEALEVVQRHQVEQSIRSSLDEIGQVDEMYPTTLPSNVDPSRVLAQGRRETLEFLLRDPAVSSDVLRRNFRHVVHDSDVTGPVFVQEFRAGDTVGRAFSTSAGRETGIVSPSSMTGGYYGEAADAALSRSQVQARNALGLDNHADQFATFTIPEDTYAVASQIGEQFENYGGHAVGGNRQYTFPGEVQPVDPRVTRVGRFSRGTQRTLNATVGSAVVGSLGEDLKNEG